MQQKVIQWWMLVPPDSTEKQVDSFPYGLCSVVDNRHFVINMGKPGIANDHRDTDHQQWQHRTKTPSRREHHSGFSWYGLRGSISALQIGAFRLEQILGRWSGTSRTY